MLLPWYNNKLINYLKNFLKTQHLVFEYGGGNSTIFYSGIVEKVFTIEANKNWFDFIELKANELNLKGKIELKLCANLQDFALEIESFTQNMFDVIVVDSRDREKCLLNSISHIKNEGIIILDNSERENLQNAKSKMLEFGFYEEVMEGERWDGKTSTSSIFYK